LPPISNRKSTAIRSLTLRSSISEKAPKPLIY
jgi:hypothetical protein